MTSAGWRRLDRRMVLVSGAWLFPPLGSTLLTLLLTGGRLDLAAIITLGSIALTFVIVAGAFAVRFLTTRFRIGDDRVELHSGAVFRQQRSVRRDRIRSVDVTASPLHRVLGLRVVRISSGEHAGGERRQVVLDGISLAEAEDLRRRLTPGDAGSTEPIATARWGRLRYAPLTVWGVAGVGIVVGGFFRLIDSLSINPADIGFLRAIWDGLTALPLWSAIVVPVLIVLALGVLTSLTTFVETWWDYRLEPAGEDAVRLRRGLFSTRVVWLERQRLRGVQIAEPVPLRWARGARLNAIAVGLGASDDRSTSTKSALLPPASMMEARQVAAAVLGEAPGFLDGLTLAPAPRAALRRRLTWALAAVVLVETPLVILGVTVTTVLLQIAWLLGIVLLPVALAAAVDAYRSLGSGLYGGYLVTRYGTYSRRTVLLDRSRILAWSINQSVAQRRAGIATFVAMVGAGRGGYKIRDVALAEGLALARAATPEMFAELAEIAPESVGVR
ncbi:PH domain-containing protein [Paractinoplanes hotanensis]|uniref:PH domain-containing protein n=1 Tax=Paractinoplanes hotanensis TaxID=2906497 RepID=A0ABT0YFW4_9ACTN|nr:PH domain-containing protein [Actinoplanes hotanensis]MCM4084139.1 PH domain-containing protein [Actinoplanes hotanensis]